jgi:hypothetical protein
VGHAHDNGWDTKPKLDEARVIAPEESTKHRARKDRRHWCKGKVGVEHAWEIRLSKWTVYMRAKNPENQYASCGWRAKHDRINTTAGRQYLPTGEWSWHCGHNHVCTNCGKILERYSGIGKDCPVERPPVPTKCNCWSCKTRKRW